MLGLAVFGLGFMLTDGVRYFRYTPEVYLRFWPQRFLLIPHMVTATVALIVAPPQFVRPIRRRWPRFHRGLGWVYGSCAIVSAIISIRLVQYSNCAMCIPGFVIWALLWLSMTVMAMVAAIRRNFDAHRRLMVRSFVLLCGFVFVRIDAWHFVRYPVPELSTLERAATIIWLSWVVPFLLLEMGMTWIPEGIRRAKARGAEARPGTDGLV